jgi:pimeloyl-ACP methyl ester carboxylesterase
MAAAHVRRGGLLAPIIRDAEWGDFRRLVATARAWLHGPPAAVVGHSMGPWLALATYAELGIAPPPTVLLAPVLGSVRIGDRTGVRFVPPREGIVQEYLMLLDPAARARLAIVAADGDINTNPRMVERLIELGTAVDVVPSNHRLTEGAGPSALERAMMRLDAAAR